MVAARLSLLVVAAVVLTFLAVAGRSWTSGLDSPASPPRISAAGATLESPVLDQNFPDPGLLEVDGKFYAFATNTGRTNIPAATSTDLVNWTVLPDAMPQLAPWVAPVRGQVWAPEVIKVGDDYRMYYTAHDQATNRQCTGVASSTTPEGPYVDTSAEPLICPPGYQRAIDASPYHDGKQLILYFSGVIGNQPNGIYAQSLSSDGLAVAGTPTLLLRVDATWEGSIAEAPTMLKHSGKLYLFYSGNDYRNQTYAVGYATCKSAMGPCTKAKDNPILATGSSSSRALGPGHQSIAKVGNEYWMVFHGWDSIVGYREGGSRVMWLQPLTFKGGKPIVGTAPATIAAN